MKYRHLQIFTGLTFLAIVGLAFVNINFLWWLLPLAVLYFTVISWGASNIRSNFFINTTSSIHKPGYLALTFDDGPDTSSSEVLKVLHKHKASATFFCIGRQIEAHPDIAHQMLNEGHLLGNHTYSHPLRWGWSSTKTVRREIEMGNAILHTITGKKNKLFRPPFGVTNPMIARALNATKLNIIGWDLRSLDTAIKDEEKLYQRIVQRIKTSSILLMHDSQTHTPAVLDRVLDYCYNAGIKIVSLPSLLEINIDE